MSNPTIDEYGTRIWRNDKGQLHRIDGPAKEYACGDKYWCVDGKRHRLDGPAIEYTNGYKAWYFNGELHRLDGPAVEYTDGHKEWWVNDVFLDNPLDILKHGAKLENIAEYLTPREIALCRTQE